MKSDCVRLWCLVLKWSSEPGGTCEVKPLSTKNNPAQDHATNLLLPSGVVGNFAALEGSVNRQRWVLLKTDYAAKQNRLYDYFEDNERKVIKDFRDSN